MPSALLPRRGALLLSVTMLTACVETGDAVNDGIDLPINGSPLGGRSDAGGTSVTDSGSTHATTNCPDASESVGADSGATGGADSGSSGGGGIFGGILDVLLGNNGSSTADAGSPSTPSTPSTGGSCGASTGSPGGGKFAGRAQGCSSYGLPMAPEKCSGYYCNISQTELEAMLPNPAGKCGNFTAARVCDGALTRTVASCSRSIKSANPLDNKEQIRAKVQACVMKEPQYSDVTEDCLGCFLDAAQCASDNCLFQCLSGDSSGCDTCRMNNNCNQPVPSCAGLPSPF